MIAKPWPVATGFSLRCRHNPYELSACSTQQAAGSVDSKAIQTLFEQYKDANNEKMMLAEGVMRFCEARLLMPESTQARALARVLNASAEFATSLRQQDIAVDPSDVVMIVLSYNFSAGAFALLCRAPAPHSHRPLFHVLPIWGHGAAWLSRSARPALLGCVPLQLPQSAVGPSASCLTHVTHPLLVHLPCPQRRCASTRRRSSPGACSGYAATRSRR